MWCNIRFLTQDWIEYITCISFVLEKKKKSVIKEKYEVKLSSFNVPVLSKSWGGNLPVHLDLSTWNSLSFSFHLTCDNFHSLKYVPTRNPVFAPLSNMIISTENVGKVVLIHFVPYVDWSNLNPILTLWQPRFSSFPLLYLSNWNLLPSV